MTSEFLIDYWPFIIGGALILLVALIIVLTRRDQRVELDSDAPSPRQTLARTIHADPIPAPQTMPMVAVQDRVAVPASPGASDDLCRIKGVGPKIAAQLGTMGIVRFEQLAALDASAQAALDAQLGSFTGRMTRDRWIEQADLLARNDVTGFEAQFGKLG